jgi:hypothetical protein
MVVSVIDDYAATVGITLKRPADIHQTTGSFASLPLNAEGIA